MEIILTCICICDGESGGFSVLSWALLMRRAKEGPRRTPGEYPRARRAMTDNRFYVIYALPRRVEAIIARPSQPLAALVAVATIEDIHVLLRSGDGHDPDELAGRWRQLQQVGNPSAYRATIAQHFHMHERPPTVERALSIESPAIFPRHARRAGLDSLHVRCLRAPRFLRSLFSDMAGLVSGGGPRHLLSPGTERWGSFSGDLR